MSFYLFLQRGGDQGDGRSSARSRRGRTQGHRVAGGKMHAFYFAFGPHDVVVIAEFPDNVSAAATSMALGASGQYAKAETTVLMTVAESMAAMKKTQSISFKPPQ